MAASARPHTQLRDVLGQAWYALIGRRTRSMLTAAGIGVGIAATVATVGVTASAAGAISDKFDALKATQVTLSYADGANRPPTAAVSNVVRLNGVRSAGLMCQANRDEHAATAVTPAYASGSPARLSLVAAQPSALTALGGGIQYGRAFDDGNGARGEGVALLDTVAARDLDAMPGQLIYLDGQPVTVFGIFVAPTGEAQLTEAVVVPYERCLHDTAQVFGQPDVVIRTVLGAADQVAGEARLAVDPANPDEVAALVPPDLRTFRQGVEGDTRTLFLGLAAVSLVIGALGISNTTLVSVLERRPEIGLRRAVGASRRAVAAQFLLESGLLGLAGGLLGTVVAIDATAATALAKSWLIVLDPRLIAAGPLVGLAVGTLAGAYPAWAASRVAPAATLRGE